MCNKRLSRLRHARDVCLMTLPTLATGPALFDVRPLGDRAVRVTLGTQADPGTPARLRRFCARLAAAPVPGVREWVPAYTAVTVYYDPAQIGYDALCLMLHLHWEEDSEEDGTDAPAVPDAAVVDLPVRYGGADGPDLPALAARHGLCASQVVALHAAPLYDVVLVGFLPGFPYLRGLPDILHTPRLPTPRLAVPAGSVGIGGAQTGVYPCASPGGWHLLGRTDTPLFDVSRDPPALLRAGDRVRFVPV